MFEVLSSRLVGRQVGDRVPFDDVAARPLVKAGLIRAVPKPPPVKKAAASKKGDD
jgi:hypothetical protein